MLRRGLPLEAALGAATERLERGDDRAHAHAIAAAVLRHLRDLDDLIDSVTPKPLPPDAKARFALRIALAQALELQTAPHAAISTVLPLVDGGPRKLVHGVFGALMRKPALLPQPPRLPEEVERRWAKAWGRKMLEAARDAVASPPPIDLTLANSAETEIWAERLGAQSLLPGHLRLPPQSHIAELTGYAEGAWWVQDIAASIPARLLGAGHGCTVLDLCAAPGGKTMQLAAAGWQVTAVDVAEPRLVRLSENLARTKLGAETVVADARGYNPGHGFDAVLVDAPCSATGIFRRHPDVLHRARPRVIAEMAEMQKNILDHAARLVSPGGTLVYAVCSLEPEEGEQQIAAFVERRPEFQPKLENGAWPLGLCELSDQGSIRIMPGRPASLSGADGFFIALLKKSL